MNSQTIQVLVKESGKTLRTVTRALEDLELDKKSKLDKTIKNLLLIYLRIEGTNRLELRETLKKQILELEKPKEKRFDREFKKYLIDQSNIKDKLILKKTKEITRQSEAIVNLSNKLMTLVDDMSMLRIQDTGTVQRLYDKNVLADLLTDLEPGSTAYKSIELLLNKLNSSN